MNSTVNKHREAVTECWHLCKANYLDEVQKEWHFAPTIKIADCTLRDGEQQAGIVFTKEDKITIAKQLARLGIHEIEVGTPASSSSDQEAAKEIAALSFSKTKVTALARCMREDIDLLAEIGVWGANISMPIGDLQREVKLKVKSKEEYIEKCLDITQYAKSKGLHVNWSPYDTTRSSFEFLFPVIETVAASGYVDRIRLVDSVGSASPDGIRYMVREMKKRMNNVPLEIHVHDDFGLAMANTIAAVTAGADVISSTFNGVGERCGNVATEEIVLTLQMLYGIDLGIDCSLLKETSDLVERLSNVQLCRTKSIVGKNAFAHESGLAVAGMMKKSSFNSEPYLPELVGQERSIVLGKKSGRVSVETMLRKNGITEYTPEQITNILIAIKSFSTEHKRSLEPEEFSAFCADILHSQKTAE